MLYIATLSKPIDHLIMTDKGQAENELLMGPLFKPLYKTNADSFSKKFEVDTSKKASWFRFQAVC